MGSDFFLQIFGVATQLGRWGTVAMTKKVRKEHVGRFANGYPIIVGLMLVILTLP